MITLWGHFLTPIFQNAQRCQSGISLFLYQMSESQKQSKHFNYTRLQGVLLTWLIELNVIYVMMRLSTTCLKSFRSWLDEKFSGKFFFFFFPSRPSTRPNLSTSPCWKVAADQFNYLWYIDTRFDSATARSYRYSLILLQVLLSSYNMKIMTKWEWHCSSGYGISCRSCSA